MSLGHIKLVIFYRGVFFIIDMFNKIYRFLSLTQKISAILMAEWSTILAVFVL